MSMTECLLNMSIGEGTIQVRYIKVKEKLNVSKNAKLQHMDMNPGGYENIKVPQS